MRVVYLATRTTHDGLEILGVYSSARTAAQSLFDILLHECPDDPPDLIREDPLEWRYNGDHEQCMVEEREVQ